MENYPKFELYRALYARYYHGRDSRELLELLQPLSGAKILDLCAGDGRLTTKALEQHIASVTLVDKESDMVPERLFDHQQVYVVIAAVHNALSRLNMSGEQFDRVVCQQAVNYWLDEVTAKFVALVLKPGGIFAFNTFNEKPQERPRVFDYVIDGHFFVEVSWLVRDVVHHVQIRDGMEPHHTAFKWLSPERFFELLDPYFVVSEDRQGKTSLYRCVKR